MSARFSKPRSLAGVLLIFWGPGAHAALSGPPYLEITGPAPLRFEVAVTRPLDLSVTNKTLAAASENTAETPPLNASTSTNALPDPPRVALLETNETTLTASSAAEESPAPISVTAPTTADNLLIITPQMLAEYFRPAPGGTNGAGAAVFLPVSVGFRPPTEKNPASSRATYKVQ